MHLEHGTRSTPTRLAVAVMTVALVVTIWGSTASSAAKSKSGGTLTYLVSSGPATLDPASFSVPTNQSVFGPPGIALFDALAVINPETFKAEPRMLKSWRSSDATVWTLTLLPNLQFSDGTPLDAAAVKVNFERTANPATRAPQAPAAQEIASMRVVNATTLEVALKAANGFFPESIAISMPYVISPTQIANDASRIAEAPIGAGPFVVKEWVKGSSMTFERNPRYYGKVYLDRLILRFVADPSQVQSTLLTGGAQLGFGQPPNVFSQLAQSKDFTVESSTPQGGYMALFNMKRAPFDDVRARQAVIYAIDQKAMSDTLTDGTQLPARAMFTESSPYFVEGTQQPAPNAKKAQALFDELAAAGKPLTFTFMTVVQNRAHAEYMQAALSGFRNVTAKVEVLGTSNETTARARAGNFDAYLTGISLSAPDPTLPIYFGTGGASNSSSYSNPTVDAAFAEARATTDVAEQRKRYDTALKQIFKDAPLLLFVRINTAVARSNNVRGYTSFFAQNPDWSKIWLKNA